MDIYFLQLTPQHYIHGSIEALKRYHHGHACVLPHGGVLRPFIVAYLHAAFVPSSTSITP